MSLSKKINWLLTISGITTYAVSKATGQSTQFLDRYKLNPEKISGMSLGKAEILEDYIENLTLEDIFNVKKSVQQILISDTTEEKIQNFFNKNKYAAKLNWIKPHKDMFIVNFDTFSGKTFKKIPYSLEKLYFIHDLHIKNQNKLFDYLNQCAKRVNFDGSRNLFKIGKKSYQIVYVVNKPSSLSAISVVDIFETDTYLKEREVKLSDEDGLLSDEDLFQ